MGMIDDVRTAYRKDPALHGLHAVEVFSYPGLWAIWFHRLAHWLWLNKVPLVPRMVSDVARFFTGIEIHPGARIGKRVFIDHGTGIVIGETAEVGDDCVLYHGVTLGARGWWVDRKGAKRHPTIGNDVTLAVGATILGAVTVGDGSRIGPNATVLDDVPANCVVMAPASTCVKTRGEGAALKITEIDNRTSGDVPAWMTAHEMGGL